MNKNLPFLAAPILASGMLAAAPVVQSEYGAIQDGAWKFPTITSPSKSDTGRQEQVTIASGNLHPGGAPVNALNDGLISTSGDDPAEAVFFEQKNPAGGTFRLDLGKTQPIRQINSYSFHQWDQDQGGRTPQVYTLSGSVDGVTWTKIADVDSRPNKTGEGWGNRPQAVRITDATGGDLGSFRYLSFEVEPTLSPLTQKVEGPGNTSSHTFFTEIDIHTASSLADSRPANTARSSVEEIIVVIKTHFDIGYTHRVKDIVQLYRTGMIDHAMNIMDQSKNQPAEQQFAWTGPGWVMSKALEDWDGQTPERRKRLDDYVKSGKFQFHALPFSLESDACEPEEMARGFTFSSNLSRKFGRPLSISGKMSDVPSHGGALATVLANGGVKFMHIGCNWPSGFVQTPGIFWWEGPDGSRVLTFYSGIYGTATGFNWPDNWIGGSYVGHHLLPPKDWPHKIWPAIMVTMDNSGPPSAKAIENALTEVRKKLPGVKVRFGTMDDFATAFLAGKPELPVVKGEMPDTWIHGIMCDPGGSKLSRAVHPQLASAEALHTQLELWGTAQPAIAKDVALAYENILLYGEHTWGAAAAVRQYGEAFKSTDPKLIESLEASWEDKTDYIRTAAKITDTITAANLKTLSANVKAPKDSIVVYNPLPWPRSGTVEVNGRRYFAKDVPPCGYLTLNAPAERPEQVLESPFFKVALDPDTGSIASLVDKRSGREWVDAAAERKPGQYLNERFTYEQTLSYTTKYQMGRYQPHPGMHKPGMISEKVTPYRAAVSRKGAVLTETNSATIECPADPTNHLPATALRITLPQDQPYVELELTIKDKAKDNWPEADWLCLPFKVANPQFRVHRQLGVMNPATDILPGANRDLFSVGHGVTITGSDGTGIAISPLDHPLVSLDRPGCWTFSKDAGEFTPAKPVVYLNLYNNQWNTNFRYWYPGTWSSRVRISTFDAKTPRAAVIAVPAIEARNPLAAIAADGTGTKLPAMQSGLTVSRPGVPVTAFGGNPDGPGTLLRVWEQSGEPGDLTITIPGKFSVATPVNLRGEKIAAPLPIRDGKLTIALPAFAPASFVLDRTATP